MNKVLIIALLSFFSFAYSQKIPTVMKTNFSKEALLQTLENEDGKNITIQQILDQHKDKILVIDFWASWCRDCIVALPKAKELEIKNPNINFIFFSLERNKEAFHKSIKRFTMEEKENYWFSTGWKNDFNNYIDLNWIPRYMIIDQQSNIAKYYAISPEDPEIQTTIERLTKAQL